jgi:hypothetical protein
MLKCSDIADEHVIDLARRWHEEPMSPCVIDALVLEGVPPKLAYAKVLRLVRRRLLDYGTTPRCAWPTERV